MLNDQHTWKSIPAGTPEIDRGNYNALETFPRSSRHFQKLPITGQTITKNEEPFTSEANTHKHRDSRCCRPRAARRKHEFSEHKLDSVKHTQRGWNFLYLCQRKRSSVDQSVSNLSGYYGSRLHVDPLKTLMQLLAATSVTIKRSGKTRYYNAGNNNRPFEIATSGGRGNKITVNILEAAFGQLVQQVYDVDTMEDFDDICNVTKKLSDYNQIRTVFGFLFLLDVNVRRYMEVLFRKVTQDYLDKLVTICLIEQTHENFKFPRDMEVCIHRLPSRTSRPTSVSRRIHGLGPPTQQPRVLALLKVVGSLLAEASIDFATYLSLHRSFCATLASLIINGMAYHSAMYFAQQSAHATDPAAEYPVNIDHDDNSTRTRTDVSARTDSRRRSFRCRDTPRSRNFDNDVLDGSSPISISVKGEASSVISTPNAKAGTVTRASMERLVTVTATVTASSSDVATSLGTMSEARLLSGAPSMMQMFAVSNLSTIRLPSDYTREMSPIDNIVGSGGQYAGQSSFVTEEADVPNESGRSSPTEPGGRSAFDDGVSCSLARLQSDSTRLKVFLEFSKCLEQFMFGTLFVDIATVPDITSKFVLIFHYFADAAECGASSFLIETAAIFIDAINQCAVLFNNIATSVTACTAMLRTFERIIRATILMSPNTRQSSATPAATDVSLALKVVNRNIIMLGRSDNLSAESSRILTHNRNRPMTCPSFFSKFRSRICKASDATTYCRATAEDSAKPSNDISTFSATPGTTGAAINRFRKLAGSLLLKLVMSCRRHHVHNLDHGGGNRREDKDVHVSRNDKRLSPTSTGKIPIDQFAVILQYRKEIHYGSLERCSSPAIVALRQAQSSVKYIAQSLLATGPASPFMNKNLSALEIIILLQNQGLNSYRGVGEAIVTRSSTVAAKYKELCLCGHCGRNWSGHEGEQLTALSQSPFSSTIFKRTSHRLITTHHAAAPVICGGCRLVRYCNSTCQKKGREVHDCFCKPLQAVCYRNT